MENNTTPESCALELERWNYLLVELGHDYDARTVCEQHIADLKEDLKGYQEAHAEGLYATEWSHVEEGREELDDLNLIAAASHLELQRRERLISQWKDGPQREQDKVIRDLRRDLAHARTRIDEYVAAQTGLWDQLGQATEKTQIFEDLIRDSVSLIEQYADDHNSAHPTDVTVILPRLRATFAMAKYEGWVKDWLKQQDLFSE